MILVSPPPPCRLNAHTRPNQSHYNRPSDGWGTSRIHLRYTCRVARAVLLFLFTAQDASICAGNKAWVAMIFVGLLVLGGKSYLHPYDPLLPGGFALVRLLSGARAALAQP